MEVYIVFLLPLVAICLETIDVCIWLMFVFMSVVVTVPVGMFVVYGGFFCLGVLKYVGVRGVMDDVFSVCIVTCGAVGSCVWEV